MMKKLKYLGLLGGLGAAVSGAVLAPGTALADNVCCDSQWSQPVVRNANDRAECDVAVGGGRIDGEIVDNGNDLEVFYSYTSSAAYSPAIRHITKCNNKATVVGDWSDQANNLFGCYETGVEWTQCKTRLADGFYCGSSCSN